MIDDKSLERCVKNEAKNGVTLYKSGEEIWFIGTGWAAMTTEGQMRERLRGTLGTIVEMLGHMPEDGAIRIKKEYGAYTEQGEMAETVGNLLDGYIGPMTEILQRTPLHFRGRALWQAPDNRLYAVQAAPPAIAARETVLNEKGCIIRRSEESGDIVYAKIYRPDYVPDDPDWEWLEERLWVDFGPEEECGPGDAEQMEMEDGDES